MIRRSTRWLLGATTALIVLFLGLTVAAYRNCRAAERDSQLIISDAVPGSNSALAIRLTASTCARFAVQALIADDPARRADCLARAHQAETDFLAAVQEYKRTMQLNPGRDEALIATAEREFARYQEKRKHFEELLAVDPAASRAYFDRDVVPIFVPVTEAADALVAYNQGNAVALAHAIAARSRNLRIIEVAALGMSLVCGAILLANIAALRRERRTQLENEHRLRAILDNLSSLIGLCDTEGRLIDFNRTAMIAAGAERDQLIGKFLQDTPWRSDGPNPEAQQRLRESIARAAAGVGSRRDVEFRTRDGGVITLDFRCDPVRDPDGKIRHLVVSGIDVTERDKLKQQFLRAQRMEAIGTLASGLAHDLNNILAPMLMAAGLLKLKLTDARDREIVAMIETSVQRGAGIIRQLLGFGKGKGAASGSIQLRHLTKDLAQIIRETFPRNIDFEHDVPATLHPIAGDPTQLHQVMLNLCVNARDAMPNGGKLVLRARNVELSVEDVRDHDPAKPGSYVQLVVSDTGEGMPPQVQERIFEPFFSTKPTGKGTGLGLPSVLAIVKDHRGFLTVDTAPGRGTAFTIHLPVATQPASSVPAPPPDRLPNGNGEAIMLVDDEPAIRETLGEMLQLHQYRVITAHHGEEAVQLFIQNRESVKLVICDMQMPIMSGPELIRSLRVLEPKLKFIVMTGSTAGDRRDEVAALEVSDIIDKPCSAAKLLTLLRDRLAQPGATD